MRSVMFNVYYWVLSIFYGLFGDVQSTDEAIASLAHGDKARAAA